MAQELPLEEREREYSPSSRIGGNYAPHLSQYAELSAAALATHAARRNLAYGPRPSNRLDLFVPSAHAKPSNALPPLLVFIHGGYWQELSKEDSLFPANGCIPADIAFGAIDYTLAPAATIEEMVRECRAALRWLHQRAADFGFDADRIVVSGSSAGAHLAAMCCLRNWAGDVDLPVGSPAAAVLVSGIYDVAPLIGTSIAKPLALHDKNAARVSPQGLSLAGFPPAVICFGEIETSEFKRQSRAFADALEAANSLVKPELFEVPARNHFDVILALTESGTALGDATLSLLR